MPSGYLIFCQWATKQLGWHVAERYLSCLTPRVCSLWGRTMSLKTNLGFCIVVSKVQWKSLDWQKRPETDRCESKLTSKKKTMGLIRFTCKPKRFSVAVMHQGTTIDATTMIKYLNDTSKRFMCLKTHKHSVKKITPQWTMQISLSHYFARLS